MLYLRTHPQPIEADHNTYIKVWYRHDSHIHRVAGKDNLEYQEYAAPSNLLIKAIVT